MIYYSKEFCSNREQCYSLKFFWNFLVSKYAFYIGVVGLSLYWDKLSHCDGSVSKGRWYPSPNTRVNTQQPCKRWKEQTNPAKLFWPPAHTPILHPSVSYLIFSPIPSLLPSLLIPFMLWVLGIITILARYLNFLKVMLNLVPWAFNE